MRYLNVPFLLILWFFQKFGWTFTNCHHQENIEFQLMTMVTLEYIGTKYMLHTLYIIL